MHRRFFDWLLMREAVNAARAEEIAAAPRPAMLRLARAYADVANAVFDLDDRIPLAPVFNLYREAIFHLLAKDPAGKKSLTVTFETAPQSILADVAQDDASLARLRHVLALHASLEAGNASLPECRDVARITRTSVQTMLDLADGGELPRLLRKRRWRAGLAAGFLLAVLALLTGLGVRRFAPRDLAVGQPWRTSSATAEALPDRLLFHTLEEMDPWFEVDLARAKPVRSLYVKNRADCCQERAVPLVVEVSNDRAKWQEVARRDSPFLVWEPSFPVVRTRYVRLRAPRRSWLHLEQVKVF